jgi:hypothetical protein
MFGIAYGNRRGVYVGSPAYTYSFFTPLYTPVDSEVFVRG